MKQAKPYVGDDGIYIPSVSNPRYHTMLISRELFVEAYNKWIKGEENNPYLGCGEDDADCWCE